MKSSDRQSFIKQADEVVKILEKCESALSLSTNITLRNINNNLEHVVKYYIKQIKFDFNKLQKNK